MIVNLFYKLQVPRMPKVRNSGVLFKSRYVKSTLGTLNTLGTLGTFFRLFCSTNEV